jgi:hypothetical protein
MQDGVSVKEGGIRGGNGLERGFIRGEGFFILREGRKDFGGA